MKLKIFKIILLILLILIITSTIYAAPIENNLQGFFPDTKKIVGNANIIPDYEKYAWYQYNFDIEKGKGLIDFNSILNLLPNILFIPLVLFSKLTTVVLISCYKTDIFNMIPDAINTIILSIKNSLFNGFYEIVVALAGFYGIYKTSRGAHTSAFKISLSTVIIFGLSIWFFSNPSAFARGMNQVSEELSVKILHETTRTAANGTKKYAGQIKNEDDSVVLLGNLFWEVTIQKPYELVQFGRLDSYDPDEFLTLQVGSKERQKLANSYAKTNAFFQAGCIPARIGLAFIMLILGLVYNICMLIMSGTVLFNHLGSLFWICFAGVFFLAALYPSNGLRVLQNWAIETFGFLIKKIIITIALCIYFAITTAVYSLASQYGYLMVIALNITLLIIAIIKHDRVYEVLMGLFTANQGMVNRGMQKETLGSKVAKTLVGVYAGQKLYDNYKTRVKNNRKKNFEHKYENKAVDLLTQQYNNEKLHARKQTEEKLMQRYKQEKEQAEKRGKETNRKPEYSRFVLNADKRKAEGFSMWTDKQLEQNTIESDYVKEVDFRKQKGYSLFSDDQIKSTLNNMYKLKEEGNNPDRLLYTNVEGKNEEQIQHDQNFKDQKIRNTQKKLNLEKKANNEKIEDHIEAYPYGHFKTKAFIKSYGRKGANAIGEAAKEGIESVKSILNPNTRQENTDEQSIEAYESNINQNNVIDINKKIKANGKRETIEIDEINNSTVAINKVNNNEVVQKEQSIDKKEILQEAFNTEVINEKNISNSTTNREDIEHRTTIMDTSIAEKVINKHAVDKKYEQVNSESTKELINRKKDKTIKENNVTKEEKVIQNAKINKTYENETIENINERNKHINNIDTIKSLERTSSETINEASKTTSGITLGEIAAVSQLLNNSKRSKQQRDNELKKILTKLKKEDAEDSESFE